MIDGKHLQSLACRTVKKIVRYEVHPLNAFGKHNLTTMKRFFLGYGIVEFNNKLNYKSPSHVQKSHKKYLWKTCICMRPYAERILLKKKHRGVNAIVLLKVVQWITMVKYVCQDQVVLSNYDKSGQNLKNIYQGLSWLVNYSRLTWMFLTDHHEKFPNFENIYRMFFFNFSTWSWDEN